MIINYHLFRNTKNVYVFSRILNRMVEKIGPCF